LGIPRGFSPYIVIGHDDKTGPHARALVEDRFHSAHLVHIAHNDPRSTARFKGSSSKELVVDDERDAQHELAQAARVVVAVGPRLCRQVQQNVGTAANRVRALQPGFQPCARASGKREDEILVLGRMKDKNLKGIDLFCRAVGMLISDGFRAAVAVRGLDRSVEEWDRFKEWAREQFQCTLYPRYLPFTARQNDIEADYASATLVCMPSREEGFGLVALEAIEHGVPVLVSPYSGFAELVKEKSQSAYNMFVMQHASADDPAAWARQMRSILEDPGTQRVVAELQQQLAPYTWETAADSILRWVEEAALAVAGPRTAPVRRRHLPLPLGAASR
jgi:glycosyltransferase involved in cell wall biosynthesis